ncbi:MAG: translocation/assembly module TamB domain-containing protein [Pacificimonas sp.]
MRRLLAPVKWTAKWTVIVTLVTALVGLALWRGLDTEPGRRFAVAQLARIAPDTGLRVAADRIDGSLYGTMTVRGLRLSDPEGVFLSAPIVEIEWSPWAYLWANRLEIGRLGAPTARWHRQPQLVDTGRDDPLLPSFDIDVAELYIGELTVAEPVIGQLQTLSMAGSLETSGESALVAVQMEGSAGDRVRLRLAAMPDRDLFDLEGEITAPENGLMISLMGLDKPIDATISGEGSWSRWRGQLDASTGDEPLADLAISVREGTFVLTGDAQPQALFGGVIARLMPDGANLSVEARPVEGALSFVLDVDSPAITLTAGGKTDRQLGALAETTATIRLLRPTQLIRTLTGAEMKLGLNLVGPLAAPSVDYRFTADWFALGNQRIVAPVAVGEAGTDAVPTNADFTMRGTLARLQGAGDLVEDLSEDARITGAFVLDGLVVSGADVQLATREMNARGDVELDLRTGRYDVRSDIGVPNYAVRGLGRVAVTGRLRLTPDPVRPRALKFAGPVSARLLQLDNDFLRFVFGGLPRGTGNVVRGEDGVLRFSNARVSAPDFSGTATGAYRQGQQIEMTARGTQAIFGPVTTELRGDITRPRAVVDVESYPLGLVISDIRSVFEPQPDRYEFTAAGETILGEVTADGFIDTRPGQLGYTFERIALADVEARGTLTPVGGVPVEGVLAITGQGLDGTARFTADDATQRIAIAASAENARLATPTPVAIRRGTTMADVTLVDGEESGKIDGRFDLVGVTIGGAPLGELDGTFALAGGTGTVSGTMSGRRGAPYRASFTADVAPDSISIGGNGRLGSADIGLPERAVFRRDDTGAWSLLPTTVALPQGRMTLGGAFGSEPRAALRFENAGLGPFGLLLPNIDLAGTLSGDVDLAFPAGRLPTGRARLRVTEFARRSGLLARPVDIALLARSDADGLHLRAGLTDDGASLGLADFRLTNLPDRERGWLSLLSAAPVTGSFAFDGPAQTLWPLAGIDAIAISGPVDAAIAISGLVGEPSLTGSLTGNDLRFESAASGTIIEDIDLEARFTGPQLRLARFTGNDPNGGTVIGSGTVDLSFSRGFPVDLRLDADNATLIDIDTFDTRVSGPLLIANSPEAGAQISGNLEIERARFRPGLTADSDIPQLDVIELNTDILRGQEASQSTTPWRLDVKTSANNRIFVRGLGLDSEWRADIDIGGPATEPRLTGSADLLRGEYDFAGRRFELTFGEVRFAGGFPLDPSVDVRAEARVEGLTAFINIRGLASRPEISFSSVPGLPEDEILARVLFGTGISNLSAPEAVQLAGALAALRNGGTSALDPIGAVRNAIGIDRLRIEGASSAEGGPGVAAGEYLGRRTYVEIATDTEGNSATQIEYALTPAFSLLGRVATFGGNSLGVRVSTDY